MINIIKIYDCLSGEMVEHGYIEEDINVKFDPEAYWHICNWSCWAKSKPHNLHSDIEYCNHGICFYNSATDKYYLALTRGFLVGSEHRIKEFIRRNKDKQFWWDK